MIDCDLRNYLSWQHHSIFHEWQIIITLLATRAILIIHHYFAAANSAFLIFQKSSFLDESVLLLFSSVHAVQLGLAPACLDSVHGGVLSPFASTSNRTHRGNAHFIAGSLLGRSQLLDVRAKFKIVNASGFANVVSSINSISDTSAIVLDQTEGIALGRMPTRLSISHPLLNTKCHVVL